MWDIVGKELNKPIYDLLGGKVNEKLRTYTYIYPDSNDNDVYNNADAAAEKALKYIQKGFNALKFDPVGPYTVNDPRTLSNENIQHVQNFVKVLRKACRGKM